MSLARIALRIATVEALKGRTRVGDHVLDSQIGTFETQADGTLRVLEDGPFVAVYTDEAKATVTDLRDLTRNGDTMLSIEFGIAASMLEVDRETGQSMVVGLGIPDADGALEMHNDALAREIVLALTDPANEWAEVWRRLIDGVTQVERGRTATEAKGVRSASGQIRIAVSLKPDPLAGAPLREASVWMVFRNRLAATNPGLVESWDALMASEPAAEDLSLDAVQRMRGHTSREARALGHGSASAKFDEGA